jgi:hypothetical protein
MTSGVYTITAPDGRQYVGSSKNIEKRWSQHRAQLVGGIHPNPNLRDSASTFGAESLVFQIVLICVEDDLLLYEQRVIDDLRPVCNLRNIVGTKGGETDVIKTAFRCPPELYARIADKAKKERMSINSFIVKLLQDTKDSRASGVPHEINLSPESIDKIVAACLEALEENEASA